MSPRARVVRSRDEDHSASRGSSNGRCPRPDRRTASPPAASTYARQCRRPRRLRTHPPFRAGSGRARRLRLPWPSRSEQHAAALYDGSARAVEAVPIATQAQRPLQGAAPTHAPPRANPPVEIALSGSADTASVAELGTPCTGNGASCASWHCASPPAAVARAERTQRSGATAGARSRGSAASAGDRPCCDEVR